MQRDRSIPDFSENRIEAFKTIRRPYHLTLTPSDRAVFEKWLLGTSAFWGVVALLIVGVGIANHQGAATAQNDTTGTVRSTAPDNPACLRHSRRDTRLVRKGSGTADDLFLGCL